MLNNTNILGVIWLLLDGNLLQIINWYFHRNYLFSDVVFDLLSSCSQVQENNKNNLCKNINQKFIIGLKYCFDSLILFLCGLLTYLVSWKVFLCLKILYRQCPKEKSISLDWINLLIVVIFKKEYFATSSNARFTNYIISEYLLITCKGRDILLCYSLHYKVSIYLEARPCNLLLPRLLQYLTILLILTLSWI